VVGCFDASLFPCPQDPKDALLREFQEEIERLRRALSEKEGGAGGAGGPGGIPMMLSADGVMVPAVERVVEKEFVDRIVEVERVVGVSEEKVKEIKEQAERERLELLNKQREEREMLMKGVERTEEERQKLVRARAPELCFARVLGGLVPARGDGALGAPCMMAAASPAGPAGA
jgi:hypothetical protein